LAFSNFHLHLASGTTICTDKVEFFDGPTADPATIISIGGRTEFCGRRDIPYIVSAPSGTMYVRFTTDGSGRRSGFRAVFTAPYNGINVVKMHVSNNYAITLVM